MRCKIFATSFYSLWDLSDALRQLKTSHHIFQKGKVSCHKYPGSNSEKVRLAAGIDNWRGSSVNFIVASISEISLTNFPRLKGDQLLDVMKEALGSSLEVKPVVKEMAPDDYVNWLAKPSLLNKIQTELYKIQPYSAKKHTQGLILDFFNSKITLKNVVDSLQDNLKNESLIPLIREAVYMREAVARVGKEDITKISIETGVPTFELLYLTKAKK